MRRWLIAAFAVLSLGAMALSPVEASPPAGENIAQTNAPGGPNAQGAPSGPQAQGGQSYDHRHRRHHQRHYYTRCHNVRVWRWTPHGRHLVWERRCHRVWH